MQEKGCQECGQKRPEAAVSSGDRLGFIICRQCSTVFCSSCAVKRTTDWVDERRPRSAQAVTTHPCCHREINRIGAMGRLTPSASSARQVLPADFAQRFAGLRELDLCDLMLPEIPHQIGSEPAPAARRPAGTAGSPTARRRLSPSVAAARWETLRLVPVWMPSPPHVGRTESRTSDPDGHQDGTVWCLAELEVLNLSNNSLRSLPDWLAKLPRLQHLDLSDQVRSSFLFFVSMRLLTFARTWSASRSVSCIMTTPSGRTTEKRLKNG